MLPRLLATSVSTSSPEGGGPPVVVPAVGPFQHGGFAEAGAEVKKRLDVLPRTPVADRLMVGFRVAGVLEKGDASDTFDAAAEASKALGRFSPALDRSLLGGLLHGAVAVNAAGEFRSHRQAASSAWGVVKDRKSPTVKRRQAALELGYVGQELLLALRSALTAFWRLGEGATHLLARSAALAPIAEAGAARMAQVASSPVGMVAAKLNRWLPLLNMSWVIRSAQQALQVWHAPDASRSSRVLAGLGLAASAGVFLMGFRSRLGAFTLLVLAGVGLDLGLGVARRRDASVGDTDAQMARWKTEPWAMMQAWTRHMRRHPERSSLVKKGNASRALEA